MWKEVVVVQRKVGNHHCRRTLSVNKGESADPRRNIGGSDSTHGTTMSHEKFAEQKGSPFDKQRSRCSREMRPINIFGGPA